MIPAIARETRWKRFKDHLDNLLIVLNCYRKQAVRSPRFWKSIWMLVCLAGFGFQTWQMTDHYFQFPVTTEARVEMEQEFIPPAISYCIDLRLVRIRERFPEYSNCRQNLFACNIFNHSLDELFRNLTESTLYDSFPSEDSNIDLPIIASYNYIKDQKKCASFRFDLKRVNSTKIELAEVTQLSGRLETLALIYIKYSKYMKSAPLSMINHYKEVVIYIHRDDMIARGYEIEPLLIRPLKPAIGILYHTVRIKYLESPYYLSL